MSLQYRMLLRERGAEWLVRAVLVGFIATVLMSTLFAFAYLTAGVIGSASADAPILARWTWALANNAVTRQAQSAVPIAVLLHVLAGLGWAVVYAALAEPRLDGPGWRRGLLFAPIPLIFSLVIFLPAVGGGLFGFGLGAGPLPFVGNVLLHLIYGVTLGSLYPATSDSLLLDRGERENPEEVRTMIRVERTTATGILLGMTLGGIGGLVGMIAFAPGQPVLEAMVLGVLFGSAAGALVGSAFGLEPRLR